MQDPQGVQPAPLCLHFFLPFFTLIAHHFAAEPPYALAIMKNSSKLIALAASLTLPATLLAQAAGPVRQAGRTDAQAADFGLDFPRNFTLTSSHAFAADLDDGGDVSTTRVGGEIDLLTLKIGDRYRGTVSAGVEGSWYDFSGNTNLIPNADDSPFSQLLTTSLSLNSFYMLDDKWSLFGSIRGAASGESDADFEDTLTFGGALGARYAFSDKFAIIFGAAASTQLEDNVTVLPFLGIDWEISETLRLRSQGTTLSLEQALTERWSAALSAGFESRQFRLNDDSPLPEGVIRDQLLGVGLSAAYTFEGGSSIRFGGGAIVYRELEALNRNGLEVGEQDVDPAPFIFISGNVKF